MASSENQNQVGGGFDVQRFFKTSNLSNPNPTSSPPPGYEITPSASQPSPSYTSPQLANTSNFQPGPFSYPPHTSPYHPYMHYSPDTVQNAHPPLRPPFSNAPLPTIPPSFPQQQPQASPPQLPSSGVPAPNPGARLMALLGTQSSGGDHVVPPINPDFSPPGVTSSPESYPQLRANTPAIPPVPPLSLTSPPPLATPSRVPSCKLPKGRHISCDHMVYDIDERLPGEVQPQLEVNPITKYGSDPGLVIGRQIAVNATYICYGLKLGAVRVLNINTASRHLLRGYSQRVTDMAFFAEDVHLLASASGDGRVFIWKITEDLNEEDKSQITGKLILAIQMVGDRELFHPRVCWHTHKQEILMVGIGNSVFGIDTMKVTKGKFFSEEELIRCPLDKPIDGIYCIGKHDGDVTDLSICQWMSSRLASASKDGTVKIWGERKSGPIAVLKPHDGQPVNSVTFSVAPERPDHIVLCTSGPLSRELKIWASASEEGWLLHSEAEHWKCVQTLELKSSAESHADNAFFNQVVVLSHAGLILLANAKKNAIYAIHVEYGPNPAATRMDYITEFTVTMPILSLTGTSVALSERECIIQIYCVQTQAIQQYALDLALCLPPPLERVVSDVVPTCPRVSSSDGFPVTGSMQGDPVNVGTKSPIHESSPDYASAGSQCGSSEVPDSVVTKEEPKQNILLPASSGGDNVHRQSLTQPPNSGISEGLAGYRSAPESFEQGASPTENHLDNGKLESTLVSLSDGPSKDDIGGSAPLESAEDNKPVMAGTSVTFDLKNIPTYLITPSDILAMGTSNENTPASQDFKTEGPMIQDDRTQERDTHSKEVKKIDVELKVVGRGEKVSQEVEAEPEKETPILMVDKRERVFYSQAGIACTMATECRPLLSEVIELNVAPQVEDSGLVDKKEHSRDSCVESQGPAKDVVGKSTETSVQGLVPPSPPTGTKIKKHKLKASQPSMSCSTNLSPFNSTDSSVGEPSSSSGSSAEAACAQILAMQDPLNQLITMQREMQKQMAAMITIPISKEGKRIEAALGRQIDKMIKANFDAMWARILEENTKHEKIERDHLQQMTALISNITNKDLPAMMDKTLKKEIAAISPNITKAIISVLEKTIPSAVADSFQKGVGDKAASQLEKSLYLKLETTLLKLIQAQFQTSVKQALQDALRSTLENSLIPAFEVSCKKMFEQVDATCRKEMGEYIANIQQQFESTHATLALGLRDGISKLSSAVQTLNNEVADGQQKILAFAVASTNPVMDLIGSAQVSNGPKVEARLDPTKEVGRLVSEHKFEEAFVAALQRTDLSLVSWLCSQVDLPGILSTVPLPLSQGVLLSLVQQLACDLGNDTSQKLSWVAEAAMALNPSDALIMMHARPILEQVYQMLVRQKATLTSPNEVNNVRMVMHVMSSMLKTCR
ncbi:enhancer of mRNA-decapping protein 4-like [Nymphaea colorata]|nr:enhancer of mRNA-decapping protein 4-like [Nymphaea colorata]